MNSPLITFVLPCALAVIMFGLGMSLTIDDFRRVARHPKAVAVALACQVVLLPAIAFGLVEAWGLRPDLAMGVMLLAASPGGPMANLFSHLFKGDLALNVSLTAINSLVALVTLPVIANLALNHYLGGGAAVGLQPAKIVQVFAVVLIPVIAGMTVRNRYLAFADRMDRPVRVASTVFLGLVILLAIIGERENIAGYFASVGLICLLFATISIFVGYAVPRLCGVRSSQAIASAFEVGIHNSALAIVIAVSVLDSTAMAVPASVYVLAVWIPAFTFGLLMNASRRGQDQPVPVRRRTRRVRSLIIPGTTMLVLAPLFVAIAAPALVRLPGGLDRTVDFAGTIQSFDPATTQLGATAPITAERRVRVLDTDGDTAVLETNLTVHTPVNDSEDVHTFAISRKDFQQVPAPDGAEVEDQLDSMTLSRPASATKSGFTVYNPVTQTAQPVEYVASRTLEGRAVHDFAGVSTDPVRSPALLAQLRAGVVALAGTGDGTSVPKGVLLGLGRAMSPEQATALGKVLAQLPAEIPLVFTATTELELAIDTELGAPVETRQTRTLVVNIDTGAQPVPLVAMTKLDMRQTEESVKDQASFLDSNATKRAVVERWVPLALAIGGLVLLGLGLRNRRRPMPAPGEARAEPQQLATVGS